MKQLNLLSKINLSLFILFLLILQFACNSNNKNQNIKRDSDGKMLLTLWAHHGKPEEWKTIQNQVARFNKSQDSIKIELIEIAEGNYDTQVQSAAATDELPDILDFDGPMLANYAWKGYLKPLDSLISKDIKDNLHSSIISQGTYSNKLYSIGTFNSGLALYGNSKILKDGKIRIPNSVDDSWTIDEFNDVLKDLSNKSKSKKSCLDIKKDYKGEWWTYGFYPIIHSAGSSIINKDQPLSSDKALNSTQSVNALKNIQNWIKNGYIDPNTDGQAFTSKRVGLSWVGHWEYPRYKDALGEDLILIPLPNFGKGTFTANGSWCWGITRNCQSSKAATTFLKFILQDDEVLAICKSNGAVPATKSAIAKSELYKPDGPLHLFVEQLNKAAVSRPVTPAYPVITSAFQKAMINILDGSDVKKELDNAVIIIENDIKENEGYPVIKNK